MVLTEEDRTEMTRQFLLIDDHEAILAGILPGLQQRYPKARIVTAKDVTTAEEILLAQKPNFVVVDLILPVETHTSRGLSDGSLPATAQAGLSLLQRMMSSTLAPNLMVLSIDVKPLIRLKAEIDGYQSGFVAMNKSASLQDILAAVDIALRGSIYLPLEVRARPEFDARWLQVLTLKYMDGLSDRAIAGEMGISDRTVRNYWNRIQDALNVYDDNQKDIRIQIQQAARRAGLIP